VGEPKESELLPSIVQILKRAGALERAPGVDVQGVSRLPVFQSRDWRRSIAEFLRWSGSTPDAWGSTSVFELMLCHGSAGARAIFEAYRHDRLERAGSFEEAQAQLEAVRTVVSMAAYWLHVISWDLRGAPRLSVEEFRVRRRVQPTGAGSVAGRESTPADRANPRLSDLFEKFLFEQSDSVAKGRISPPGVPIFPGEAAAPNLWKSAPENPEKPENPTVPSPPRWRPRTSRP
jgi:hypothetical protein